MLVVAGPTSGCMGARPGPPHRRHDPAPMRFPMPSREVSSPMPVQFPTLNPETGELVPTDYYTVGEVAEMLHVSHSTVRRRILAGEWPHLTIAQGHYMSAPDVGWVVERNTVNPEPPPAPCNGSRPELGIPLSDTDLEGIR